MKTTTILTGLSICLFLSLLIACNKSQDESLTEDYITVTYMEGLCCQNLVASTNIELPSSCGQAYDVLFATNLDEFNIPQDFQYGDILEIKFEFTTDCEAEADQYNCIVTCDTRHGVPINITAVK